MQYRIGWPIRGCPDDEGLSVCEPSAIVQLRQSGSLS